jgi:hypothetical protein
MSLTRHAEQALLGAMLTDPGLLDAVVGHVRASDFESRRHVRLYQALTVLAGQADDRTAWAQRAENAAGSEGIPAWYLPVLTDACPDPSHGDSYARLVLQASSRRQLYYRAKAVTRVGNDTGFDARRLERADGPGGHRLEEMARQAEAVASQMRAYARAFDPDESTGIPAPRRAPGTDAHNEELVLAALIQRHPAARRLTVALDETAFTSDARADIFTAIRKLGVNARDIDVLTVAWEAARQHGSRLLVTEASTAGRGSGPGYVPRIAALHVDTETVLNAARPLAERAERHVRHPGNGGAQHSRGGLRLIPQPPAPEAPEPATTCEKEGQTHARNVAAGYESAHAPGTGTGPRPGPAS